AREVCDHFGVIRSAGILPAQRASAQALLTVGLLPRFCKPGSVADYRVAGFQSQIFSFPLKPSRRYTLLASRAHEASKNLRAYDQPLERVLALSERAGDGRNQDSFVQRTCRSVQP